MDGKAIGLLLGALATARPGCQPASEETVTTPGADHVPVTVGIAACDDYARRHHTCVETHAPAHRRAELHREMDRTAATWSQLTHADRRIQGKTCARMLTTLDARGADGCPPEIASLRVDDRRQGDRDRIRDDAHDPNDSAVTCAAGHRCSTYGATCKKGRTICTCAHICRGAEMTPGEQMLTWSCRTPDPKCPDAIPQAGARCRPEGLRCGWGTCGGTSASCENRRWEIRHHDPPP